MLYSGEFWSWGRGKNRFSTSVSAVQPISPAAVTEEPINPAVKINHTQLLINGQFVDAASGSSSMSEYVTQENDFLHIQVLM